MKVWDQIRIGGPILPESHFGPGFEADYTKPLAASGSVDGIVGTTQGFSGDPFNFTYPTDGQYKLGGHLTHIQNYATSYAHPHVSDQRNNEPIYYPHPAPLVPDPLTTLEKRNGKLVLKARPTTQQERDTFARIKGYALGRDGQSASTTELDRLGIDYSGWDGRGGNFFHHMPTKYIGCMISTYNRHSLSWGRCVARITVPFGVRYNGDPNNWANIEGWFPAYWGLRSVQPQADLNTRSHALDTYTPGNPGAGGKLEELDYLEAFGDPYIHVTSHLYRDGQLRQKQAFTSPDGTPYIQSQPYNLGAGLNDRFPLGRDVFVEVGMDRFPSVFAYHINGVYVHFQPVPDYLAGPKIVYQPVDGSRAYIPVIGNDDRVVRLGEQLYESNDQPAHPHFCDIFNIAQLPSFARDFRNTDLQRGNARSYRVQDEMQIEWHRMVPLIDDQPDSRPYINYTVGENEFSSGGTGTGTGGGTGGNPDPGGGSGGGGGTDPGGGNPNPGTPAQPPAVGYVPDAGEGVRFRQGHQDGIVVYELQDPGRAGPGRWRYDDYGDDAVVIGADNQATLVLEVSDVDTDTARGVWWEANE